MKREIKFRAWSRTGEWDEFGERRAFEMIDGDSLCPNEFEPFKDSLMDINDEYYVMQFTGLKDKNGKEIYEGDIIDNYASKWIVTFNKGCFCANKLPELQPDENTHIALRAVSEYEVIGNIYQHEYLENPELLK